ncbi:hypothetical protein Pst134EA_025878 [Puccinia striiformis f. sp. tritici]|uniref:hypothetical protein n=1 Tax=Puccinia striiformis f. sp. tritici TaxID=168172 RepID=UPI0020075F72|nr:hypothetical protein Pst134EA_025878 [Puccinia striiformis f. sp. tritici]KAH9444064.1 hypothetical protein Pst134EB_026449 [Puccinia striiformis f. sp. tritici]KAH9451940.1 hypothetical protein Pst134EA_025878 [Puccinia striiformis f. sp. tritici]KAI9615139.1 hypothetical protein H4Q26_011679 [Puccinia striiformis f. sp. tritici PST-130]
MVNRHRFCVLLHAATLIIAPPVNPGQLHKHLDNLGQSWQSILSRCSDSIKFAANQLKEIPSSWADRPAEPEHGVCASCDEIWSNQGFFDKWRPCTHNIPEAIRCPICLEDLYGGQEVKQRDNCCHLFHTACLSRWEHIVPTCPMCRTVNEGLPSSSATTRPLDGEAATNQVITILGELNHIIFSLIVSDRLGLLDAESLETSNEITSLTRTCREYGLDLDADKFLRGIHDLLSYSRYSSHINDSELTHLIAHTIEHSRLISPSDTDRPI